MVWYSCDVGTTKSWNWKKTKCRHGILSFALVLFPSLSILALLSLHLPPCFFLPFLRFSSLSLVPLPRSSYRQLEYGDHCELPHRDRAQPDRQTVFALSDAFWVENGRATYRLGFLIRKEAVVQFRARRLVPYHFQPWNFTKVIGKKQNAWRNNCIRG